MTSKTRWRVDRSEGVKLVLERDDGELTEIDAKLLPMECRQEGAVLDVPRSEAGQPVWSSAVRNADAEAEMRQQLRNRIDRLSKNDSGGNLNL